MKHFCQVVASMFTLLLGTPAWSAELSLVTLEFPPYEYATGSDVKGVAVEIVKETFKRMGQPVTIKVLPWARAIKMIEDGDADGIFTAYKNPEREAFADYSKEVVMPQIVSLFVKKDSTITFDGDLAKLSGFKFGIVRSLSYGEKLDTAIKNKVLGKSEEVAEGEPNFRKLIEGRVEIVPSNKYVAVDILNKLQKNNEVKELTPEVQNVPSYIAFSKKRNLASVRDKFDETLKSMKAQGVYDKIIADFFKAAR